MPIQSSGLSLYNALIFPLRQLDQDHGMKLLERYLKGPQEIHNRTESDIQTLLDQVSPIKVRSDLLQYLKDIVGFTAQLRNITDRLSERQLRRLIQLAVPMWNERETEKGIINTIRLLTGRNAALTNWFGFRFLLSEAFIGEDQKTTGGDSWIIGGAVSLYDEFFTNIRVMDDGTLDEILLLEIVRLHRALSERVEVFLLDFLDEFDMDLSLWDRTGGSTDPIIVEPGLIGDTGPAMRLSPGTEVQNVIPILPLESDHVDYVIVTKFALESGASKLIVRWYLDATAGHFYQLTIQLTSPRIEFRRSVSAIETVLATSEANIISWAPDTYYKLRIQTLNIGDDKWIRVYIDNSLIIPTSGTDFIDLSVEPSNGPYRFKAIGGTLVLDNVESWRIPARFATVEISTLTERGGEITKTPNFVQ